MKTSKKLKEFEDLWVKIEKLRKDPKMMKALDRLIKLPPLRLFLIYFCSKIASKRGFSMYFRMNS